MKNKCGIIKPSNPRSPISIPITPCIYLIPFPVLLQTRLNKPSSEYCLLRNNPLTATLIP